MVGAVLAEAGKPLAQSEREYFEPRFGASLADVRIHSGPEAARAARDVSARAFTIGPHVVLGATGDSDRMAGQELLAHELAHVVQQSARPVHSARCSGATSEAAAVAAGSAVARGAFLAVPLAPTAIGLARAPLEAAEEEKERERAFIAAQALAAATAAGSGPGPFSPTPFTVPDADGRPGYEREEAERQRVDAEGRRDRLITVRRYFSLHGVSKWDVGDMLSRYLSMTDMLILRKAGLRVGRFNRIDPDDVVEAIDKVVEIDAALAAQYAADLEDVQLRAAMIEGAAQSIEGVASGGPISLGARIAVAVPVAIAGGDWLGWSEAAATLGGAFDMGRPPPATKSNPRPPKRSPARRKPAKRPAAKKPAKAPVATSPAKPIAAPAAPKKPQATGYPGSIGWAATSRAAFMRRALAIILANPAHRLRFLVDPKTRTWHARSHLSGKPTVQAGHLTSRHSGAPERYGLQDSFFNQVENWRGETQGAIFNRPAVDIDGVPVELGTVQTWHRMGELP